MGEAHDLNAGSLAPELCSLPSSSADSSSTDRRGGGGGRHGPKDIAGVLGSRACLNLWLPDSQEGPDTFPLFNSSQSELN